MNLDCLRETLNCLTAGEIIGDSAEFSVNEVCETLDSIKNLIKGQGNKKTKINSNTPQKIMKLYSANFEPEEIADMLDLTVEEVMLVTTTSDNEITAIAQRMYKSNMPIYTMSEVLGVPVESIEQMFGISDEVDDEDNERDLSLHINGYNSISGKTDDDEDDPASIFANTVFDSYIADQELKKREQSALIDEQNFEAGYDHTGH